MKRLQLVKNFAIIIICLTEWAKVMFFIPEKEASFSGTKHSQNLKRTTNYVFGLGFFFFTETIGRSKYGKDYGFAQIGKALKNL